MSERFGETSNVPGGRDQGNQSLKESVDQRVLNMELLNRLKRAYPEGTRVALIGDVGKAGSGACYGEVQISGRKFLFRSPSPTGKIEVFEALRTGGNEPNGYVIVSDIDRSGIAVIRDDQNRPFRFDAQTGQITEIMFLANEPLEHKFADLASYYRMDLNYSTGQGPDGQRMNNALRMNFIIDRQTGIEIDLGNHGKMGGFDFNEGPGSRQNEMILRLGKALNRVRNYKMTEYLITQMNQGRSPQSQIRYSGPVFGADALQRPFGDPQVHQEGKISYRGEWIGVVDFDLPKSDFREMERKLFGNMQEIDRQAQSRPSSHVSEHVGSGSVLSQLDFMDLERRHKLSGKVVSEAGRRKYEVRDDADYSSYGSGFGRPGALKSYDLPYGTMYPTDADFQKLGSIRLYRLFQNKCGFHNQELAQNDMHLSVEFGPQETVINLSRHGRVIESVRMQMRENGNLQAFNTIVSQITQKHLPRNSGQNRRHG